MLCRFYLVLLWLQDGFELIFLLGIFLLLVAVLLRFCELVFLSFHFIYAPKITSNNHSRGEGSQGDLE